MSRLRPSVFLLLALAAGVAVALLPWVRNHAYLRDLYDYGLVIKANGLMAAGERPYVDFATPIQAGFLALNGVAERLGGGGYAGLARGGAALIVLAVLVPALVARRRWPAGAAVAMAVGLAAASAAQHTILWHNALGVFCLTVGTWAAALAPVPRRGDWALNALVGGALFLGGINKLNFHLVTVVFCAGWALREGITHRAGWSRVWAGLGGIAVCGLVAPLAFECGWTGASLQGWFDNVVALAAGARGELLGMIFSRSFFLGPVHAYYGALALPQVGLIGFAVTIAAVAGCWPRSAPGAAVARDRWLLPLAALGVAGAGAALIATNYEIASIGLAAWLALAAGLWLGFAPERRGRWWLAGLLAPVLAVGASGWWSAWQGQRSQFGYSDAPRARYQAATDAGPAYSFLAGLRLPPDLVESLAAVAQKLPEPDEKGQRLIFFSLGTEWMERAFPVVHRPGRPLWVHWGTSYNAAEIARLEKELAAGDAYEMVFNTVARDSWPESLKRVLETDYLASFAGPRITRRTSHGRHYVNLADSFATLARMGGNYDAHFYHFDRGGGRRALQFRQLPDGRLLLGTRGPTASALLRAPSYHLRGLAVLARLPEAGDGTVSADFKLVEHGAVPENRLWGARLTLPVGQQAVELPFELDTLGHRAELWVVPADNASGGFFGGFRELELTNSIESSDVMPELREQRLPETAVSPELTDKLFGSVAGRAPSWMVRGGELGTEGLRLAPGGELWLRTAGMTGEVRGRIFCALPAGVPPYVRVVWYKGARLQILQQGRAEPGRPFEFRAWTAEPGGWIGLLVDPAEGGAPAEVRVDGSTLTR